MAELAWIVPERAYQESQPLSYFTGKETRETLRLRTPDGLEETITGFRIPSWRLREASSEVLYLHLVQQCNLACHQCGNHETQHAREGMPNSFSYIDGDFIQTYVDLVLENPFPARRRVVFESGGEPLLDLPSFLTTHNLLKSMQQTDFVLITNAYYIPLVGMEDYLHQLKDAGVRLLLSYKEGLQREYERYRDSCFVPKNDDPLGEKIRLVTNAAERVGISCMVNVIEPRKETRLKRKLLTLLGDHHPQIFSTPLFPPKGYSLGLPHPIVSPCSQGEELSISFHGTVYPHCYLFFQDIFSLGKVGLLVDKIA